MLKLKDLTNRQYVGKQCKTFAYVIEDDNGAVVMIASFNRISEKDWSANFVLNRTEVLSGQVYWIDFSVPKAGMPLETIAATGLRLLQLQLKEEIQAKITMDFTLGEKLEGM